MSNIIDSIRLSGTTYELQDLSVSGKVDSSVYTAFTASTDTALSNKVSTSAVTSAVTSGSTDVLTSGGAYTQFGGMKLVKLTESEYQALSVKDTDVLYVVIPDPTNP